MHKQLSLFQNAITAYFAGNKNALENCMKEFHVKITSNESKHTSFLEPTDLAMHKRVILGCK